MTSAGPDYAARSRVRSAPAPTASLPSHPSLPQSLHAKDPKVRPCRLPLVALAKGWPTRSGKNRATTLSSKQGCLAFHPSDPAGYPRPAYARSLSSPTM